MHGIIYKQQSLIFTGHRNKFNCLTISYRLFLDWFQFIKVCKNLFLARLLLTKCKKNTDYSESWILAHNFTDNTFWNKLINIKIKRSLKLLNWNNISKTQLTVLLFIPFLELNVLKSLHWAKNVVWANSCDFELV